MQNNNEFLNKLYADRAVRTAITRKSHFWFFNFFLPHYVEYPTADFQKEMFRITEDKSTKLAVIVAFRGSAKSTIMTLSYPLLAVLGVQQKKFVLILAKTQGQAKVHFSNLKRELETNELLRDDLGPFELQSEEWGQYSIVLPKYKARITAASSEQSIRGLRHGAHRPDLIIVDDPEDIQSVKTLEGRDKTWQWLTGEVIPAGDRDTKIIVVGNLLHEDSVMMRLKDGIEKGILNGIYRQFPLVDADGVIAWPGKFSNQNTIQDLQKSIGSESAFQREYLLRIITSDDQVIKPEWIQHYDGLPSQDSKDFRYIVTGIDLAISERESANYTAMVSARVYGYDEDLRVYILPNPVNERLDFPAAVEWAQALSKTLGGGTPTKLIVEEVGYQKAFIDHAAKSLNLPAVGLKPLGNDKRQRLSLVSHLLQQGKVLFPKDGASLLIQQLLGFGKERYDDLVDAFVILLLYIIGDHEMGYTWPGKDQQPQQPISREEAEKLADEKLILYQQGMRGDKQAMRRYYELVQKEYKLHWNEEERKMYNQNFRYP